MDKWIDRYRYNHTRIYLYKIVFIGFMAAQGLLNNPAMYAGYRVTPEQCIKNWVSPCIRSDVYLEPSRPSTMELFCRFV